MRTRSLYKDKNCVTAARIPKATFKSVRLFPTATTQYGLSSSGHSEASKLCPEAAVQLDMPRQILERQFGGVKERKVVDKGFDMVVESRTGCGWGLLKSYRGH